MNNNRGFVLIECCAYLMICAILTVTIMRWLTQTVVEAGRTVQSTDRVMMAHLVHDVLTRDLHTAPSNRSAWLAIKPDHMVWKKGEESIVGWYKHNKQLIRKEGNYNSVLQQWGKHHASTAAHGVTTFICEVREEDNAVRGVKTTLCLEEGASSVRYVRLRNGRVS